MDKGTYIHALDNGLFTLGAPHKEGLCLRETVEGHLMYMFYDSHLGQILTIFQRNESTAFDYQMLATPSFQCEHLKTFRTVQKSILWKSKTT